MERKGGRSGDEYQIHTDVSQSSNDRYEPGEYVQSESLENRSSPIGRFTYWRQIHLCYEPRTPQALSLAASPDPEDYT